MVASLIVGLLMLMIWRLVATGAQFYRKVKSQGDIQRDSLLALRWMAKDLSEGSAVSFRKYVTETSEGVPTGFTHAGIVFGSPNVKDTGNVAYNAKGRMLWSSVIGYYIDPVDNTLYRQQLALGSSKTFPPIIENNLHSTDVMAGRPGPRVVARNIHKIETTQGPKDVKIELSTRDTVLGFGIKVQTRLEMKN